MIVTDHDRLEDLVRKSTRLPEVNIQWLKDELYAIDMMGLSAQFLELAGVGDRANPSRSLVAYVIGVTSELPSAYPDLVIHKGRVSPPDVDIDIDDRRREEAIEYARQKYGEDRVAHIGTFGRVKGRQAIRDAGRILDLAYEDADSIAKMYPDDVLGNSKTIDEAILTKDLAEAVNTDPIAAKVIDVARGLEHSIRQWGIHAAGVIIASDPVTDTVPVMRRVKRSQGEIIEEGPITSQWDMHRVEQLGLLKMDFLGLRNLGVIDLCLEMIESRHGEAIDMFTIPLDDPATYTEFCAGNSEGVFQVESSGLRTLMVQMQPEVIEDISALIALYRPGPLGSGMHEMYVQRKHGREQVNYYHPCVEPVLKKTYGVLLYQEQVIECVRKLAGFNAAEADLLRKSIGKKLLDKISLYKDQFVKGCKDTNNIDERTASAIFKDIEYFAGYGFAKAHSASYAMITYITQYLKTHYPPEYMAALLSNVKNQDSAAPYLNECRRLGITVAPPSINHSTEHYTVIDDNTIMVGIRSIRGIGESLVPLLTGDDRNYTSIYDFLRRVDPEVMRKNTLEHLARSGALDELVEEQPERTLSRSERMEILDFERKELGLFITEHPLTGVWHLIESQIECTIGELRDRPDGSFVDVGGILSSVEKKNSRRGNDYYILTLEDLTGSVEVLVFSNVIKDNVFEVGDIVVITGRLSVEGDEDDDNVVVKLFFTAMDKPELPEYGTGTPIIVNFDEPPDIYDIDRVNGVLHGNPGDCTVYLRFPDGPWMFTLAVTRPASESARESLISIGANANE